MPTTISTSTANPVLGYPSQQMIDRNRVTGYLYALLKNSSGNYELFRSTNQGTTWTTQITLTRASIVEWSNIYIDYYGYLHWAYRTNESSQDRIYYRRLNLNATLAWSSEVLVASPANGGVAGAIHTGIDIAVGVGPTQWYVAIGVGTTSGASIGVTLYGVTAIGSSAPYANNNNFAGTRAWFHTGSGRITPSLDLSHTGDAKTNPYPDLWVAFGRSKLYLVRLAWNGNGWVGPTGATLIETLSLAHDSIAARWDGSRFLMCVQNPADTDTVRVYERNSANSSTTRRTTGTHTTGVIRNCAVNYNQVNGDIRVFAVGTSTAVVYFADFIRATGLWSSWAVAHATAVLGNNQYCVRESSYGTARHDLLTAHSGPTQVHSGQVLTYAPTVPAWNLAGAAYQDGGPADVALTLPLVWTFASPDPVDAQTAFALRRQIGAGALAYFKVSTLTWESTEQKNLTATTSRTLAAAWGADGDANHVYWVKVWDASDTASSYSLPLTLVPSAKVNPVIVDPTAAEVHTTDHVEVVWTATEQTAYRLILDRSILDLFGRSASSGWGSSDTGEAYTTSGGSASDYSVSGGLGRHSIGTASVTRRTLLPDTTRSDFYASFNITAPVVATGNSYNAGMIARQQDNSNLYLFKLEFTTSSTVLARISRFVAGSEVSLGSVQIATYAATNQFGVSLQAEGSALRIKAWKVGETPPSAWTIDTTDTTFTSGQFGFSTVLFGTNALPVVVLFDNLEASSTPLPEYDSGWVADSTTRAVTPPVVLPDLTGWVASLRTKNVEGLQSDPSLVAFTIDYIEPATPTLALTPLPAQGYIQVAITNPTPGGGQPALADQELWRRTTGDTGDGIRLVTGLASGATYNDWKAVHGVAYDYRVRAFGVNGTSIYSAWSA